MTVEIVISAAVVSAVITVIGSIITAKMSRTTAIKAAQEATDLEIRKLERTWAREDVVSSDDEFAEMASAVAAYLHYPTGSARKNAVEKVAAIRAKEHGILGTILDQLYAAIIERNEKSADKALTAAINQKRELTKGLGAKDRYVQG